VASAAADHSDAAAVPTAPCHANTAAAAEAQHAAPGGPAVALQTGASAAAQSENSAAVGGQAANADCTLPDNAEAVRCLAPYPDLLPGAIHPWEPRLALPGSASCAHSLLPEVKMPVRAVASVLSAPSITSYPWVARAGAAPTSVSAVTTPRAAAAAPV